MKRSYKILVVLYTILSGLSMSAQNLVDMNDWISGTSGATTNYILQGTASQNSRITMTGPYGNQVTVWEASADGATGMNGGFEHTGVDVDTDKTYRISFWVQSTGPHDCTNRVAFTPYYIGGGVIQSFDDENGGSVTWPYISSVSQPNDKWYLVVGYIRPGSASDLGDSGVYDPSVGTAPNLPATSFATTDFIFPSTESQINVRIRSFMWACGAGEKMFVYDPRLEETSNAPALSDLLYGTIGSDTQDPTAPTLSSTGQTDTTIDLSWTGATDDTAVTGYKVFKDGVLEATLGNVSTYQVTGLSASTAYSLTVTALDAASNESVLSNAVNITTNASSGGGSGNWTSNGPDINYTSGSVGIGTLTIPNDYKLAVEGKVISEEIKVQLQSQWPDYVFNKNYDLPTLEEVQKHISEKGHLMNIPSAKEVKDNGIELGEMNKLLLEKIEELTLYAIQQKKKIQEQDEQLEALKKLEHRIDQLENKTKSQE